MILHIRWFTLAFLTQVAIVATSAAQGYENGPLAGEPGAASKPTIEPDSELTDPFDPAARWLLDQSDARKRAAALLYLSGPMHGGGDFDADALLDEFERAIETTTDGAALAWLAAACATADIEAFCVDAGLDDAIVRHDGANLFSRLTLFPGAQAETRDRLIIEAENTQNYVSQLPAVWFEALDEGPGATALKRPHDKLVGAFSISMAYAIPAYQPLILACGAEITPGGELDRACGRIAERMISDSQTAIGQSIGISLASSRAEARGDQATVARLEQRKIYENAVRSCRATALTDDLENLDESGARDFMEMLDQHGEIEAWARLAAQHDVDCSDPDGLAGQTSNRLQGKLPQP